MECMCNAPKDWVGSCGYRFDFPVQLQIELRKPILMEIHLQLNDYLRCYYYFYNIIIIIFVIVMSRAVAVDAVSVSVSVGKPNEICAASITFDGDKYTNCQVRPLDKCYYGPCRGSGTEAVIVPAAVGGWNFPISQIFIRDLIKFASLQRTPESLHLIRENTQLYRLTDCGLSMSLAYILLSQCESI